MGRAHKRIGGVSQGGCHTRPACLLTRPPPSVMSWRGARSAQYRPNCVELDRHRARLARHQPNLRRLCLNLGSDVGLVHGIVADGPNLMPVAARKTDCILAPWHRRLKFSRATVAFGAPARIDVWHEIRSFGRLWPNFDEVDQFWDDFHHFPSKLDNLVANSTVFPRIVLGVISANSGVISVKLGRCLPNLAEF